ncbi:MAG: bifunctional oligoribonuclease/PAP phosphatase NrnA [Thermodesulfobacteriota bacterium]|nr:bifunctional oligoribonuclease/PAP phosphatase NrnA [Thermodesulfobacteriota bacterium]
MFDKIVSIINSCRNFLITAHVRPDGDAIGSELALYHTLRDMGKEVVVYNQDETPESYRFLPGSEIIVNTLESLENFDVVFVLDCSKIDRIGDESSRVSATIKKMINIDHHISNGGFCDISLIDPEASSTGEILYRLLEKMKVDLTEDIAINLYTAILTDTGSFRHSNTGKDTFTIAGKLVEKGADPQRIAERVYETNPSAKIKLLTKTLHTLEFNWDGKIGSIVVTQKMLGDAGALSEYTEGFVDFVRSIKGVEVAVLYSETSENNFRISLRSKGRINVERVAGKFRGGGHSNASACIIEGDIDTVKRSIVTCIVNQQKK